MSPPNLFPAILLIIAPFSAVAAGDPNEPKPAPPGFPSFEFAGHDEEAALLSDFLWRHFHERIHMHRTLFYQEYLGVADLWMGGAPWKDSGEPIQEIHRRNLLGIELDDEGYVLTHQHYSHAHEHGWPFPLWPQSGLNADQVRGVTAGWHFQTEPNQHGWVWNYLRGWGLDEFHGEQAIAGWELDNCWSEGIVEDKWRVIATGPSPTLTTPTGVRIDAANAPFLQLRYRRTGAPPHHRLPYVEWQRAGDADFSAERRMYVHERVEEHADVTDTAHVMVAMHRHPLWRGTIKRIRLCLAPGEDDVQFAIDSFFTCYDTRHTINNPLFICASANYFKWTGDLDFLRRNINRMRTALRYQMTVMGGREHKFILNQWPGHDGIPGWTKDETGRVTLNPGHGIGNNYYDLIPFGWKDCHATILYYGSLTAMAEIEAAIREHPGWSIPCGALAFAPHDLKIHAADVKRVGNDLFWNEQTGRYLGAIDRNGRRYDYGFTWLALEAIWFDFAPSERATIMMDWISGRRIVNGDTSTGDDIYRWRFGPRTTTLRNVEWYGQCWISPESIPFGGQVQDGGAVLGFTFYDLCARLQVYGPDDAWARLQTVLDWEAEVQAVGGYRTYYADGKRGTTLQGGGTAGGIGIDFEFFESSLVPSSIIYGFLGIRPGPDALHLAPRLPTACPSIGVKNLTYAGAMLDIVAEAQRITIRRTDSHAAPPIIDLKQPMRCMQTGVRGHRFELTAAGTWTFEAGSAGER